MSTIIASVRDISSDKQYIEELDKGCNQGELSPIHFFDVVEDFTA
ncbi:MAG: DUF6514 family protein [Eubacteriales bacterium]